MNQEETLPDPKGGCACHHHEQDAGGGYTEHIVEPNPACPEHSEHLYDPREGAWVFREPHKDRDWWRDHAESLEAERDRLRAYRDRVEALFSGGPDTPCRTTWSEEPGVLGETYRVECVEVPMDDLRAALNGGE